MVLDVFPVEMPSKNHSKLLPLPASRVTVGLLLHSKVSLPKFTIGNTPTFKVCEPVDVQPFPSVNS